MCAYYIILYLILKCCLCTTIQNANGHSLKKNGGFLFSMPKILVSGKNETVCLSLHDTTMPAKAIIDFKWKERHFPTIRVLETEHSCFELYIPDLKIKEPYYVNIRIQVQLNDYIESSHNQDPVILYPNKLIKTFINTDREMYKPGDKVKFRILAIDEQLLPQNSKIPEIKIRNPLDTTVAVWENVAPENGLISLEYQMVPESITGKWTIEASGEVKVFEVFKYVLPRFQVKLLYPRIIYHKAKTLNVTVCGQYSYGRPVKGVAFIKVRDSQNNMAPVHRIKEMQNGCGEFFLSTEDLSFSKIKEKFPTYDPKVYVYITATITEKGTNKIDITNGKSIVLLKPYTMKIIANTMFQPGLPYKGIIKFNNVQIDLSDELIEICYNLAIKKSWNYLNKEQCSNFTVNRDNTVDFTLLPLKSNVIHIHLNARSLNHSDIGDSFMGVRLFSPSSSYIYLVQHILEQSPKECRAAQQFAVYYTTDKLYENETVTFYYMIKSRNHIYKLRKVSHVVKKDAQEYFKDLTNTIGEKNKFTKSATALDNLIIQFKLDKRIGTKYQLLVYYVSRVGETVAVTKNVDVAPCLLKVEANWLQKQLVPGATATLDIKTGTHAMCSISAVDKATKFLYNNQVKFEANTLFRSFGETRDYSVSGRKNCIMPTKKNNQVGTLSLNDGEGSQMWDLRRRKRHVYSFSEDYDTYDVLNNFGTVVITNLRIITKPCYTGPLLKDNNPVQFLSSQYEDQNEEKAVTMRSYFPETWLWELVPVSGQVQVKRHLPHSITNWVTNVLCISDDEGIGFSQESELKSFQSFFVEIVAPHSVKKGETFYLYIHMSNYLNYKFPIRLTLRLSEGLELENLKDELSMSYCLAKNNTLTHTFQIKGMKTGRVNATVLAESDNQYPKQCGPETILYQRDIFLKTFQVESEGYPVSETKSALLCASDIHSSNNVSWNISPHKEIVPGTDKTYINLNADLLGATIENLEELLDIPTGCGEQVMASIAPNLYVLNYLNTTNALKSSIRHRIVRNLKIGYQRILNYAHKDGSFSAFGYHDASGSMFLTAFVVRTLQEARKYIYVDQKIIDKAVAWIFDHQLENGCFNAMLHVFQDMGGTSKENSTSSLTAYVITSLMEANIEVPKIVQTNAKYCIRSQHNPDKYTLAISCYAMFKIKWFTEARRALNRLIEISNQHQNMMWWTNQDNNISTSTDIEITSYVLLSLLHENTTENLAYAHSIVRWLSSKYNRNGGFKSTQDTVVALDALSKYLRLIGSKSLDLTIHVEAKRQKKDVILRSENKIKSHKIVLDHSENEIKIVVEGDGCVLTQLTQSYYLMHVPKSEAFKLAVDVAPVSTIDQCSITSVSPCLAYVGPDGPANMAVMEVTLPSGYEADRASLYQLVESESTSKVKMFEELQNKLNLYFTKLDKQLVCFSFNINEQSLVETRKDSVVKLYDYYRPEYEILQFYSINKKCLNNDSGRIPEIPEKALNTIIKLNNVTIELKADNSEENNTTETSEAEEEENIVKRSTDNSNFSDEKNVTEPDLNIDFVEKDIDIELSNCNGNIPYYISPKKVDRRDTETHLNTSSNDGIDKKNQNDTSKNDNFENQGFVDKDIDMEFSNCSGNIPYYVSPPKVVQRDTENQQRRKETSNEGAYAQNLNDTTMNNFENQGYVNKDMEFSDYNESVPPHTTEDISTNSQEPDGENRRVNMMTNLSNKNENGETDTKRILNENWSGKKTENAVVRSKYLEGDP